MAMYKCPQCGATSDQSGECQTCHVPMAEVTEGEGTQTQAPAEETTDAPTQEQS